MVSFRSARIESFGEPAVDRRQKVACLIPLPLIAPEPCDAHRGAQFPGLRLLRSRDRKSALEISSGFSRIRRQRLKRDLTGYAIDLGLEPRFFSLFRSPSLLRQRIARLRRIVRVLHRLLSDMINTTAHNLLFPLTDMQ